VWNESDGVMDGESGDNGDEVTCERAESGRDRRGKLIIVIISSRLIVTGFKILKTENYNF